MRFLYQYRSRDNVKHTGEVNAATREAAFAALKAQGIHPERVVDAPGFFNKLFGKGKRWLAIGVLGALCIALAVVVGRRSQSAQQTIALADSLDSTTRRQLIGDAMAIELGIRTGWNSVFENEGERFLASFAIPGVPAGQRSTTEDEIRAALGRRIVTDPTDTIEARQIKAMVEGMKEELREFMSAGGTIMAYGRKLVQRQEEELAERNRVVNELSAAKKSGLSDAELEDLWGQRNGELRQMGVKLVSLPE